MLLWLLLLSIFVLTVTACGPGAAPVAFFGVNETPLRLSAWRVLRVDGERLSLGDRVLPYDLNTPLFSDYALKLRTVWMPPGTSAEYRDEDEFEFPVGTIISKTLHYERAGDPVTGRVRVVKADREADPGGELDLGRYFLAETRLLVRYEDGWRAYPYVWNAAQDEAFLEPAGDLIDLELVSNNAAGEAIAYVVPDTNQCAACHTPDHGARTLRPLGPKARQLNREYQYREETRNQLEFWQASDLLAGFDGAELEEAPSIPNWSNPGAATLAERARAYLDANCAHCHNPQGAADTSALNLSLDAPLDRSFGICKPPVAAGRGSGGRRYDIYPGRPQDSILLFRMESTEPDIAMPELGRATAHVEAIAVIRDWIGRQTGIC